MRVDRLTCTPSVSSLGPLSSSSKVQAKKIIPSWCPFGHHMVVALMQRLVFMTRRGFRALSRELRQVSRRLIDVVMLDSWRYEIETILKVIYILQDKWILFWVGLVNSHTICHHWMRWREQSKLRGRVQSSFPTRGACGVSKSIFLNVILSVPDQLLHKFAPNPLTSHDVW